MAKKSDDDPEDIARDIVDAVEADRKKLSGFFDKLLQSEDSQMVAEQVAKIADALTKQNQLRADVMKARMRTATRPGRDEQVAADFDNIGKPFLIEEEN